MSSKSKDFDPLAPQLRVSFIWRDELMSDSVFELPQPILLGQSSASTVVVPELALPDDFAVLRPGGKGYILTLSDRMAGELCLGGNVISVRDFLRSARHDPSGFHGTAVSEGDYGIVHLDGQGDCSLFFQFVKPVGALPKTPLVRDTELLAPAFAFAFVLIGLFLTYALVVYEYEGSGFLWPGKGDSVADYVATRPMPIVEAPKTGSEDGAKEAEPSSTAGAVGKAGGAGKKERKRNEDAASDTNDPPEDMPEEVQVGLNSRKSRETIERVRNRANYVSDRVDKALAGLQGPTNNGSDLGFGSGTGTGFGKGEGTGTVTKSGGTGRGGGGKAHADARTQGKIDTGGKRVAKGTPTGRGVKEVAVSVKAGKPTGDFRGLSREAVQRGVQSRLRSIRACYSRELQRQKGLSGVITITWDVDSSGRVKRPKVRKSSIRNSRVEDCVLRQIGGISFPKTRDGAKGIKFPFNFNAS